MPDLSFQVEGADGCRQCGDAPACFQTSPDRRESRSRRSILSRYAARFSLEVTRRKYTPRIRSACSICLASPAAGDRHCEVFCGRMPIWSCLRSRERPWSTFLCRARSISMWPPRNISMAWRTEKFPSACSSAEQFSMPAPEGGLQVAPISWDKEARFRLPVKTLARHDGILLSQQRMALPAQRCLRPSVSIQSSAWDSDVGRGVGTAFFR